jgi:hypothetical protein
VSTRKKRARFDQLALWTPGSLPPGADLVPTTALLRHVSCARVLALVRQVRGFFPELDGIGIKVGLTRSAAGFAAKEEPIIWVNPYRLTRHTIAHEFAHLLQFRGFLPLGERSADLHSLARHAVLVDDLPCYLKLPRTMRTLDPLLRAKAFGLISTVAAEAAARRAAGHRTYLVWFEEELARRWESLRGEARPREVARQAALF